MVEAVQRIKDAPAAFYHVYGKEVEYVREKERQQRPHFKDRREPEAGRKVRIQIHRCIGQDAVRLFMEAGAYRPVASRQT